MNARRPSLVSRPEDVLPSCLIRDRTRGAPTLPPELAPELVYVRFSASSSLAAQASVLSNASPLNWRTIIWFWIDCAHIWAAISGGAGEQTTPATWSPPRTG